MPPAAKRVLLFFIILLVLGLFAVGGAVVYANRYENKVLPGISVEGIPVGTLSRDDVKTYFDGIDKKLSQDSIRLAIDINGEIKQAVISPKKEDQRFVRLNTDGLADYLLSFGKQGNIFSRTWQVLNSTINMGLPMDFVQVDKAALKNALQHDLASFETEATNASFSLTSVSPYQYSVASSSVGVVFDYDGMIYEIEKQWAGLDTPSVTVSPVVSHPVLTEQDVRGIAEKGKDILSLGNILLTYRDEQSKRDLSWTVKPQEFSSWIEAQKNGSDAVLGFNNDLVVSYVKSTIEPKIYREPRNAKLTMEGDKIAEFKGSQSGITVKYDDVYKAVNAVALARFSGDTTVTNTVPIAVTEIEPEITTAEVNEWGIEDVLGVGYSSYKGSPANRIKNIRFAVNKKLNGILVKPGETFSMLNALKPFTEEAGYLPELVIKGDEIKPEVGGGLCQVGSTMFRAAMNSGLPIEERRNHSLTVSYYNDHRNNMPGTDATIYDPAPDFKFKNDTGSHILIMTEMNEKTQELFFTLWGKSDGRKGSYTPPAVSKWIPTGPTKEIPSTTLAPGQKKCQESHIGAVASFTYTIEKPNGEKVDRVFESYYRPLPRICLVGTVADPASDTTASPDGVVPVPGPADTAIPLE